MCSEVAAENTAGVCETVRMVARCRVEEDARGFLRLRAKNDDACVDFLRLFRVATNVQNSYGAILLLVHEDFVGHRIRNERAVAGAKCVRDGGKRRVEVRVRHAAAFAGATVVTRSATSERASEIC